MTHLGVIYPTGSHLTTYFFLKFELQKRAYRINFLNVVDVQDKVLATNLEFRASVKTEFPIGSHAL